MSFDNDMNILIQRYLKEVNNQELTIEEIQSRPRWKRVYYYRKAKELYEGAELTEMTMDEMKSIYGD